MLQSCALPILPLCTLPQSIVQLSGVADSAHTRLIDSIISNALRIVTGCLLPTKTNHQTVLAVIPPAELRRRQVTLTLARQALEPNHLLHHKITTHQPRTRTISHLKSRHSFVPAVRELLSNPNQPHIREADWVEHSWNSEWNNCNTPLQ